MVYFLKVLTQPKKSYIEFEDQEQGGPPSLAKELSKERQEEQEGGAQSSSRS